MKRIWLPDNASVSVEWFIAKDTERATGVESIREDWIPKEVSQRFRPGFRSEWDPTHEQPYDPERNEFE